MLNSYLSVQKLCFETNLYRKHNAPFDSNDFKLFEVPVFERCKKYGIPENRITKRTSPNPEMMVGLKLYAGN